MSRVILILTALLATGRVEYRDPGGHLLGIGQPPDEYHLVCCQDGKCSPAVEGACPAGGVLHKCEDQLVCNGEACWYECEAVPPPPMSIHLSDCD